MTDKRPTKKVHQKDDEPKEGLKDLETLKAKWEAVPRFCNTTSYEGWFDKWDKMFSEIALLLKQKDKTIAEIVEAFNNMRGEADEWWAQLSERDELIAAKDKEIERLMNVPERYKEICEKCTARNNLLKENAAQQKEMTSLKEVNQKLTEDNRELKRRIRFMVTPCKEFSRKRVKGG